MIVENGKITCFFIVAVNVLRESRVNSNQNRSGV